MLVQKGFWFATHLSMSNLMGFWTIFLGQSKFKGLTLLPEVNQDRVVTVLDMVANKNCLVEDVHTGLAYIMSQDTTSVIRNQWGHTIKTFSVRPIRGLLNLHRTKQTTGIFEQGNQLCLP
jgi:hypothetical protein